jgi:hypothetical protein
MVWVRPSIRPANPRSELIANAVVPVAKWHLLSFNMCMIDSTWGAGGVEQRWFVWVVVGGLVMVGVAVGSDRVV